MPWSALRSFRPGHSWHNCRDLGGDATNRRIDEDEGGDLATDDLVTWGYSGVAASGAGATGTTETTETGGWVADRRRAGARLVRLLCATLFVSYFALSMGPSDRPGAVPTRGWSGGGGEGMRRDDETTNRVGAGWRWVGGCGGAQLCGGRGMGLIGAGGGRRVHFRRGGRLGDGRLGDLG